MLVALSSGRLVRTSGDQKTHPSTPWFVEHGWDMRSRLKAILYVPYGAHLPQV